MTDLINYGVQPESSFQIMEKVRKGKGISDIAKKCVLLSAMEWPISNLV